MKQGFISYWVYGASIAVALVAALSLGVTVLVAQSELKSASLLLVRGEGEALAAQLLEPGALRGQPPSQTLLDAQLERLEPAGLRYLALPRRGLAAGESRIAHTNLPPGSVVVRGARALRVSLMPAPPGRPPPRDRLATPPLLILEFEPAVLSRVNTGMRRTLIVAAAAVLVLLTLAGVLTARVAGQAERRRKLEHDQRLTELGRMAGVMAHELRNPLTSLKGNAQLLAEALADGTREHAKAERVVFEAVRLERLTHDLLAFVRDGAIVPAAVASSQVLERALRDLPRDRIQLELAETPATIWVDETRLAVALGNLVQNALQASPEPVRVRLTEVEQRLFIDVCDRGPGIAAGDESRIFEPFFTTRTQGTGLGLAIARRAVEEHGGTLTVAETGPSGTVFRISLPRAPRGADDDRR